MVGRKHPAYYEEQRKIRERNVRKGKPMKTVEGRRFWVHGTYDPSKKQKRHYYDYPAEGEMFFHHRDPTGKTWTTKKYTCPGTIYGWSTWGDAKVKPFTEEAFAIELPPTPAESREKGNIREKLGLGEYAHMPCPSKKEAMTGGYGSGVTRTPTGAGDMLTVTEKGIQDLSWTEGLEWVPSESSRFPGGYWQAPGGAAITDLVKISPEMYKLTEHITGPISKKEISIYGHEAAKASAEQQGAEVFPWWRTGTVSKDKTAAARKLHKWFGIEPPTEEKYIPHYAMTELGEIVPYERPPTSIPEAIADKLGDGGLFGGNGLFDGGGGGGLFGGGGGLFGDGGLFDGGLFDGGGGGGLFGGGGESGGMGWGTKIFLGLGALAGLYILAKSAPSLAKARKIQKSGKKRK